MQYRSQKISKRGNGQEEIIHFCVQTFKLSLSHLFIDLAFLEFLQVQEHKDANELTEEHSD